MTNQTIVGQLRDLSTRLLRHHRLPFSSAIADEAADALEEADRRIKELELEVTGLRRSYWDERKASKSARSSNALSRAYL